MSLSAILYFVTMVCMVLITILFIKSKNGGLRKNLIVFFTSLSWALCTRGLQMSGYDIDPIYIIFPFCAGTILLTIYLYLNYKK